MTKLPICPNGQNCLIYAMSTEDRDAIEPHLKMTGLEQQQVLEIANEPIETVYFPTSGIGSMIALGGQGRKIEVGLFGRDGMSGTAIVMDTGQSPLEIVMQVGGQALAIEAERLQELMEARFSIRRTFLHYVQILATQTAQTALSNGQSKLEERLARWLLMCHDRIGGDQLELTHDFLSIMLGVRRAGVTVGTHLLEGKGLIRATRGVIRVLDRDGLEELAEASYGVPEREYERVMD
ncbi:Crp/Fnr family transcriptional regulator [uncultured Jannaschia sp.]|uniref:Crp/Fnr family transcriptional regulator n=1 Tax=uncultured Jannaschia sp. TaxID=293347 RepID=UPI00262621E8|nr:Crp/Fnr family transcriptional regulator [uncultured Jannaschia sp.]